MLRSAHVFYSGHGGQIHANQDIKTKRFRLDHFAGKIMLVITKPHAGPQSDVR